VVANEPPEPHTMIFGRYRSLQTQADRLCRLVTAHQVLSALTQEFTATR